MCDILQVVILFNVDLLLTFPLKLLLFYNSIFPGDCSFIFETLFVLFKQIERSHLEFPFHQHYLEFPFHQHYLCTKWLSLQRGQVWC